MKKLLAWFLTLIQESPLSSDGQQLAVLGRKVDQLNGRK